MKNIYLILVIFLTLISFNKLVSADIPTIVISAGKTPQSLSTVGTNVTVISGDTFGENIGDGMEEGADEGHGDPRIGKKSLMFPKTIYLLVHSSIYLPEHLLVHSSFVCAN